MFDEMRTALEVALRAGARVEPAASNPNYRVGVAEIHQLFDKVWKPSTAVSPPRSMRRGWLKPPGRRCNARNSTPRSVPPWRRPRFAEAVRAGQVALENARC